MLFFNIVVINKNTIHDCNWMLKRKKKQRIGRVSKLIELSRIFIRK